MKAPVATGLQVGWRAGPMPPDTWGWGGVVPKGDFGSGFLFADFCGDHVLTDSDNYKRIEAADVLWYNNGLDLPPETSEIRT